MKIKYFIVIIPLFFLSFLLKLPLGKVGSINFLDILMLLGSIWMAWDIYQKKLLQEFFSFSKKLFLLGIILLGVFLSFFYNLTPLNIWNSLGIIKSFYILPIVFSILNIFYISKGYLKLQVLLYGYFIYASALGIIGLAYILSHKFTFDGRLEMFFNSPNYLAILLSFGILAGCSLMFFKNNFNQKYLGIALSIIFISLYYTRSLGALIGTLTAIGFLLAYKFNLPQIAKVYKKFVFISSVLASLSIIFLPSILKITNYSPNIPPSSSDSRIAIYLSTDKIISNHFFSGIGAYNFQNVYLGYQKYFPPYPQWAIPHPHNIFLTLWLETSLGGLIVVIFLFYRWFFNAKAKTTPEGVAVSILLIYILVHGMVDSVYWRNDLALIFWFLLTYSYASLKFDSEQTASFTIDKK